ncbi:hypothetical protein E1B28_000946 [Marasmius oreades]|uniref:Protein byr4 n=1 Tax=Marasmius oreades TaxID=181124 RepID=A0A9P8AEP2_9AGAR|nr:uncharacterized protein E1B28_000946 [Marasmius oreades]KAG7099071.1 hypothetical protein E1B28_000946 [Marasmius oreades]
MPTIPAPFVDSNREEWPDADFDIPEGQPLHSITDKDDDEEDWDLEMDLGKTGSARIRTPSTSIVSDLIPSTMTGVITIRPPQPSMQHSEDDEDDDEGVSTIKAATIMPRPPQLKHQDPIDEDFEDGFSLPSDLTRLSLAPLSLNHRSSKNSLEWGDKDQTSSSQSSDAYSSLGFADASPSSNSTSSASSASLPDTETDDEDDDDVEGLIIPSEIFESGHGGRKLNKILEQRRVTVFVNEQVKVAPPDPEDDFEMGLVIDDDVDLSPSRLLHSAQQQRAKGLHNQRSRSLPTQRPNVNLRPPSRLKPERAKSPVNPPPSSARQLQKLRLSPSPPLQPPTRSQTFQTFSQTPSPSTSSFLAPKPGSLRGQKSHSGLKPPTPPPTRKLTRKASLSSLMDKSQSQASGSGSTSTSTTKARYEEPTAASRAKTQRSTTSRFKVPPTRPSTPSSNTAALRLTMPTFPTRARPALSSVWGAPPSPAVPSPTFRNTSSPLPRPPSSLSLKSSRATLVNSPPAPKVLRKPRRARTYGDGTELDNIEDLPTDCDKESRFRVQPKGYGNRIPGGTYSATKPPDKSTVRKKRREPSGTNTDVLGTSNNWNRKPSRSDFSSLKTAFGSPPKKKKVASPSHGRKKPTLIRNLGGAGGPKVVGEMKWNPQSLRWEGNEQALREFDAVVTSTRPALITHLTGSSIGSPVGSFASGARIVGNMIFDPQRMCWISTLPPEEDEPDVFANLADDEEDGDGWEAKGGTIRGSLTSLAPSESSRTSTSMSKLTDPPSPARSRTRSPSESDSDRGSRASITFDIDAVFVQSCRAAEQRHYSELSGWKDVLARQGSLHDPERADLYEIRALATRKYQ